MPRLSAPSCTGRGHGDDECPEGVAAAGPPAPLVGSLVALTMSALIIVTATSFIGTGAHAASAVDRLAGAAVVVTGSQQLTVRADGAAEAVPLPDYRGVPVTLAARLAALPGVAAAIGDESFPLALTLPGGRVLAGTAAAPLAGHSWASARLTPFRLARGTPPVTAGQIVIGAQLARQAGLRPGSYVRLTGQDLPALRVTGIAADSRADAASARSVFFAPALAAALYAHPGRADLIGVIARPGSRTQTLAAEVKSVTGRGYTVVTGVARGGAENPEAAGDDADIEALGGSAGADIIVIALFVVAGTVALSVSQRQRQFALLRAVGATPGQIRRAVLAEMAALGVAGGVAGWLPGCWLSALAVHGMVSNNLLPVGATAWLSPWLLFIAVISGVVIGALSGLLAARRAGRTAPADALRESVAGRRWPHPVRTGLGVIGLGGSVALVIAISRAGAGTQEIGTALSLLLALMVTVALLGPLLSALAELALRLPARAGGVAGRLAMAEVRAQPRRMASAFLPVVMSLAFAGTVYFLDDTLGHTAVMQDRQRLTAAEVVTAPGPGLSAAALAVVGRGPGVRDAVGLTPTQISVTDPDLETISGEVVSGGSLPGVLNLNVTAGSLRDLRPGHIALSAVEASQGSMNVHVGSTVTVWLPDGTPYRARVSGIFSRSFGFADVLIPAAAAAGHVPSPALGQILVQGRHPGALIAALRRFSGLQAAGRQLVNAQDQQLQSQNDYLNNLILASIALLAAITVVNTLVMTTVERRQALVLLRRVGATTGQLLGATAWQSALLAGTGIVLGLATGGLTLSTMTRAITGGWPYIPATAAVALVGAVVVLTLAGTLGPTAALLRRAEHEQA
jgi:putative ABC transport system permease protein